METTPIQGASATTVTNMNAATATSAGIADVYVETTMPSIDATITTSAIMESMNPATTGPSMNTVSNIARTMDDITGIGDSNTMMTMMSTTETNATAMNPCLLIANGTGMLNTTLCQIPARDTTQETVLYAVTTVIVAIGMVGIGATVHPKTLWQYIKHPKAYILGVLMQLLILPPLAWALTRIFSMSVGEALGVFIQGCSPGGTTSNIVVYWLDGIVDLSVAMTVTTTVLALGTMPLWLFIYEKGETLPADFEIPFDSLVISLVALVVPILIGMFVKVKFSKKAGLVSKILIIAASIMILTMLIVRSVISRIPWIVTWKQGVIAMLMPLIAFALGYLITLIPGLKLDGRRKRTISIETALQNVQVAAAVIQLSFGSRPALMVQMLLFPLLYYAFQLGYSVIIAGIYIFLKRGGYINLDDEEETKDAEKGKVSVDEIKSSDDKGVDNAGFRDDIL